MILSPVNFNGIVKVQCKEAKNTTSLLSVDSVVNQTTCFGQLGGLYVTHTRGDASTQDLTVLEGTVRLQTRNYIEEVN